MDWILKSPQIHSSLSSLSCTSGDVYHADDNCIRTLEGVLKNLESEDKCLRTCRRTISFGQNVQKDIIPMLINSKDDKVIGLLVKILMNLTIPMECLLVLDVPKKTDFVRHTIFELRNLLTSCKNAFSDPRVTKTVIDFMKSNCETKHQPKLSMKQCEHLHDCLNLLRNVLHINDDVAPRQVRDHASPLHNQILWNLFSQGLDKIVIKLMTVSEASNWSATMAQLVALLYKDQHVGKLQKLLNVWLETSFSESSEDNESNTSPQNRGSSTTSPILTTDQTTSDSSDNCGKGDSGGTKDSNDTAEVSGQASTSDRTEIVDNSMETCEDNSNKKKKEGSLQNTDQSKKSAPINTRSSSDTTSSHDTKPEQTRYLEKSVAGSSSDIGKSLARSTSEASVTITSVDTKLEQTSDLEKSVAGSSSDLGKYVAASDVDMRDDTHVTNKRINEEWDGNNTDLTTPPPTKICKMQRKSDHSDCGYGTQIETRESISTSSNEDDRAAFKPVHIKPRNPKHKVNTKIRISNHIKLLDEDKRRKKMVRRGKSNILNVKGLQYHQPTDDEIALVLKEFTVDFMLKGYSSLVKTLHKQINNFNEIEIDRCHFFWLLTYFLKFATQMELDMKHVECVLSFDVVSFLTAEGVNLCEQFELAVKYNKTDLNMWRRKLHLVVTAIREFVQAIETFKNIWSPSRIEYDCLLRLQVYMWDTPELRSLMVLLIRSYNSEHHDKQYLQDLVVTNHLLLLFLDNVIKAPGYRGTKMIDHIRQFGTPHMMWQYGILLDDYETNGEFVNDCLFTIMHHVGGEAGAVHSLFRPNILHAFSSIKQSDYEICDQWMDLLEYVMNSFARHTKAVAASAYCLPSPGAPTSFTEFPAKVYSGVGSSGWTEDELSALGWNYMQSKNSEDVVGNVVKLYKDDGVLKTRMSVIGELYQQSLIDHQQHQCFTNDEYSEQSVDDVRRICDELTKQGCSDMLEWVQSVLLDICYVKICLAEIAAEERDPNTAFPPSVQRMCSKFRNVSSPVIYHSTIMNKSIALVPWNCKQAAICRDMKFIQLLSKLSFFMPVDSGMMFFRIPQTLTADVIYEMALQISNIDTSKLKFSISDISRVNAEALKTAPIYNKSSCKTLNGSAKMPVPPMPEHCYRIQRFKEIGSMVQYTPTPDPAMEMENPEPSTKNLNLTQVDWLTIIKRAQGVKMPLLSASYEAPSLNFASSETPISGHPLLATIALVSTIKPEIFAKNMETIPPPLQPELTASTAGPSHRSRTAAEQLNNEITSISEEDSVCDNESVASDFSRMYVSDEDERLELSDDRRYCFNGLLYDDDNNHSYFHVYRSSQARCSDDAHFGSHFHTDSKQTGRPNSADMDSFRTMAETSSPYIHRHDTVELPSLLSLSYPPLPPPSPPLPPPRLPRRE